MIAVAVNVRLRAPRFVDQSETETRAGFLFVLFDGAEFEAGLPRGGVGREPARDQNRGPVLEMKPHLVVHVALERRAAQDRARESDQSLQHGHAHQPSDGRALSAAAIAAASRFQLSVSSRSRFRPAAVRL